MFTPPPFIRAAAVIITTGILGLTVTFSIPSQGIESDVQSDAVSYTPTQHDDPSKQNFVPLPGDPRYPVSSTALRSASGAQQIGGFELNIHGAKIPIPAMLLYHEIEGRGTLVESEYAWVAGIPGQICNYRIYFQNRDSQNSKIYTNSSNIVINGCASVKTQTIYHPVKNFTAEPGWMCARFEKDGVFVGEQCHRINP